MRLTRKAAASLIAEAAEQEAALICAGMGLTPATCPPVDPNNPVRLRRLVREAEILEDTMGKQRLTMMRASIETARAYAEAEFEAVANDHSRDDNDMHRLRQLILALNAAADFAKGLEGGE